MKSTSKTLPEPILFLDKCFGRKIVAERLRSEGLHIEILEDHFPADIPDATWIPEIGKRGWVILTKDSQIRHNNLEIVALLKANTHVFILTTGSQTGLQSAESILAAMPQIRRIIRKFSAPFAASVTVAGNIKTIMTHEQLMELLVHKPLSE